MFHPQFILTLLLILPLVLWGQSDADAVFLNGNKYALQALPYNGGEDTLFYHIAGNPDLANPLTKYSAAVEQAYTCANNADGTKISRATLNQLANDPDLLEAATIAINDTLDFFYPLPSKSNNDADLTVCCINREIIFGTKYYQVCYQRADDASKCNRKYIGNFAKARDMKLVKFEDLSTVEPLYRLFINLIDKRIYVVEINAKNNEVLEVNKCEVMSQGFEEDHDAGYELEDTNPAIACDPLDEFPRVSCKVEPSSASVDGTIIYTAIPEPGTLTELPATSYQWEFSNGSRANGLSVTRLYSSPGDYTAKVTLTDRNGKTRTAECPVATISGVEDTTLTAVCEVTPIAGPLNTNFCFSAGKSTILPEGASISSYRWDFEDNAYADGDTAFHIFAEPGTYNVTLTITDERGVTASTVCPVEVDSNTERKYPPIALFEPDPREACKGDAISFDAELSHDQDELDIDPKGHEIVSYTWDFGDGEEGTGVYTIHRYPYVGEYEVALTVTDNEGQVNLTTRLINIKECGNPTTPPPPPTVRCDTTIVICPPCNQDSCMHAIYTVRSCQGRMDTMGTTFMRVICPAPERPTVIYIGECQTPDELQDDSPLQLAGGTAFRIWRGQITEYGLGVNAQIRYRLGENRRWAVFADLGVTPIRKALPLDDRPYKWSPLRDSVDVATGLPLVWWRGTNRGTANAGLGFEFAPWKWMYIQAMGGFERSFNQREVSDPRKSDENMFVGFRQNVLYVEPRIAVRKDHMEIFYSIQFLQENRPFVFIPANNIGGSHNEITDKTHNFGVLLYF